MSAGAAAHSCYMLHNGIAHDEMPGLPGYTAEGDAAGNSGNVAVSSVINTSARSHIELWMTGPFHAIGVLRPNLQSTGFGKCDRADTPTWHSGATLDVHSRPGLRDRAPPTPILFPGNGTTTNLDRFVVESPEPVDVLRMDRARRAADHRHDARGGNQPLRVVDRPERTDRRLRALGSRTPPASPSRSSHGDNAVVIVPRTVLAPGHLQRHRQHRRRAVSAGASPSTSRRRSDVAPIPVAQPTAPATGFAPLPPARIVDTRDRSGRPPRLGAGTVTRIQITGRGGVPAGAKAVLANTTVTEPTGAGLPDPVELLGRTARRSRR